MASIYPSTSNSKIEASNINYVNDHLKYLIGHLPTDLKNTLDGLIQYINPLQVVVKGGGQFERGETVNSIMLSWEANKPLKSIHINNGIGMLNPNSKSKFIGGIDLRSDLEYTLTFTANNNPDISSYDEVVKQTITIEFQDRIYYGVSQKDNLTNLTELTSSYLKSDRASDIILSGTDQYFYIAYPEKWGEATFYINNMWCTAWEETTISYTNEHSLKQSYVIYRSLYKQNGSNIKIKIR